MANSVRLWTLNLGVPSSTPEWWLLLSCLYAAQHCSNDRGALCSLCYCAPYEPSKPCKTTDRASSRKSRKIVATCREGCKSFTHVSRTLGYERVYLPLCKVTDTPFLIQGEDMCWVPYDILFICHHQKCRASTLSDASRIPRHPHILLVRMYLRGEHWW